MKYAVYESRAYLIEGDEDLDAIAAFQMLSEEQKLACEVPEASACRYEEIEED